MRAVTLALSAVALAAAACAPGDDAPARRDGDVRIASVALFAPDRFAGRWHVAQSHVPGCAGAVQDWAMAGPGRYLLTGTDCTGRAPAPLTGGAVVTGPGGRIMADAGFGREPVFVLWVDEGYRVAVLGTPSGRWAQVLSRDPVLRPDLAAAAREVLAFNGYDLAQIGAARGPAP